MISTAPTHERSIHEVYEEALRHIAGHGKIHRALDRLTAELKHRNIGYVVIGAVALLAHGFPRYTENLDVVLTNEGFDRFRKEMLGRGGWGGPVGYDSVSEDAKMVRSSPEGVLIKFKIAGEFPGDGKAKPVFFPDPSYGCEEIDRVNFPTLEKLIELKLASGMTAPDRLKDLADVQELIKLKRFSDDFAQRLDPYVRDKFTDLLESVKNSNSTNFQE
jgi:hypothetical protein